MPKFNDFRDHLLANGADAQVVERVCKEIETSCPWLLADESISEELGVELFRSGVVDDPALVSLYEAVIEEHNRRVQARLPVHLLDELYARLVEVVSAFGIEDAFGAGDYWVVSDSIPGGHVSVMKFKDQNVPAALEVRLSDLLQQGLGARSLKIMTPDGAILRQWAVQ